MKHNEMFEALHLAMELQMSLWFVTGVTQKQATFFFLLSLRSKTSFISVPYSTALGATVPVMMLPGVCFLRIRVHQLFKRQTISQQLIYDPFSVSVTF